VSESDPLDRPATAEEIEMVERLLKRRPAEKVVTLPKARPVRKSSTEVLAPAGDAPVVDDETTRAIAL